MTAYKKGTQSSAGLGGKAGGGGRGGRGGKSEGIRSAYIYIPERKKSAIGIYIYTGEKKISNLSDI